MAESSTWVLPDEFREGLTDEYGDPLSKSCGFLAYMLYRVKFQAP